MKNPMEIIQRSPDSKDSSGIKLEDISVFKNKDFYARLAVHPEADVEDVTKAYRRKSMQYHPDRTGGNAELEKNYGEVMQLINEAYETLSNTDKRKSYDNRSSGKPTSTAQQAPGLSELQIEAKIRLFATTCDTFLNSMGIQNGMNKIVDMIPNYTRLGIPQAKLNQMILPSVQKYYVAFAEAALTKEHRSSMFSMTAPERLEILSIVHTFQRFVSGQDVTPLFKKLIKKEIVIDYYKKYLLSVKREERFSAMHRSREYILKLNDSISESELKTIEEQIRFK